MLEKPLEPLAPSAASPLPPLHRDPEIRELADGFQKRGAEELWTAEDSDVTSPSLARFLPKAQGGNCLPRANPGKPAGTGVGKRRAAPLSAAAVDTDMPLAEEVDAQRKKVKVSLESSDEEQWVVPGTFKRASHLSQTRFDNFKISPLSLKALHEVAGFDTMTVVQNETLPLILQGHDVLAKAKTGTGKTVAFLLPAIEAILKLREDSRVGKRSPINVLVICPIRELATQVATEAKMLTTFQRGLGVQVVTAKTNMATETRMLEKSPCQILVGTPGRLLDHIQSNPEVRRQLQDLKVLVLDEADQLLDKGFRRTLVDIMEALPKERQTLLFSATVPNESMCQIALKNDYKYIDSVGEDDEETHVKVKQDYLIVPLEKQLAAIYALLKQHAAQEPNFKVLVFYTTVRLTALFAELYKKLGFNTLEFHSHTLNRKRVSKEFRNHPGGVIMCTSDVSARGVDYPDVTLVLQVGTPAGREQYIHRLGRTGRAGKEERGLLVLTPWEEIFLRSLKDITIGQAADIPVSSDVEAKVNNALQDIKAKARNRAYKAWLGYYNSCSALKWDKPTLVERANLFSGTLGLLEPPVLEKKSIGEMGLNDVPGLRIRVT